MAKVLYLPKLVLVAELDDTLAFAGSEFSFVSNIFCQLDCDEIVELDFAAELIELLKLAQFGDLSAIATQTNYLSALDTQYIPFVQKVLQLATSCQQSELESLLSEYINSHKSNAN